MRRLTYILLALSFFLVSCNKDDGPAPIAKRTTLIYMAADNDLSSYAESNTEVIINAYKKLPSRPDTHLLIYKDTPNAEPQLLYIDQNGTGYSNSLPFKYLLSGAMVSRHRLDTTRVSLSCQECKI